MSRCSLNLLPMNPLKRILFDECVKQIQQRIATAKKGMKELQDAANEETKSSAGDKYETGRAMMQQEKDKYAAQLAEALRLENALSRLNPERENEVAGPGSLIITNQGNFYLGIPLGKVHAGGQDFYTLSPASPIGKLMQGARKGSSFDFNGRKYEVREVG